MRLAPMLCCIVAAPVLVAASEPVRLQPSTQWVVDYADDTCRLGRIFGTGRDETKLVLESIGPGEMTMAATGRFVAAPSDEINVGARFLPSQSKPFFGVPGMIGPIHAVMWTFVPFAATFEHDHHRLPGALLMVTGAANLKYPTRPDLEHSLKSKEMSSGSEEFFAKTTEIEIRVPRQTPLVLETGSLADPMKAFSACEHDLVRSVGVDPAVQDKVVRPPWPSNQWLAHVSFPENMAILAQDGSVQMRAVVDANGRVTACTAVTQSAPEFKERMCDGLIKYGQFAPAELADGTKVPAVYATTVEFRMAD